MTNSLSSFQYITIIDCDKSSHSQFPNHVLLLRDGLSAILAWKNCLDIWCKLAMSWSKAITNKKLPLTLGWLRRKKIFERYSNSFQPGLPGLNERPGVNSTNFAKNIASAGIIYGFLGVITVTSRSKRRFTDKLFYFSGSPKTNISLKAAYTDNILT